ncbi:MAG: CoA transferase [Anaerolineae bacterium]|nr:CoA transferase [Anaerolineae bacterium]
MTKLSDFFKSLIVVETASILAGPAVGMFLAELGATVIKVENLGTGGDTTRGWKLPSETDSSDISAYFSSVNWGKLSLGLNLAEPDGQQVLRDLLDQADIFLHNFKTDTIEKFGIGYDTLRAGNERLIYARITAYGDNDPRPGYDAILQAETGFTAINGSPDSGSTKMPVALIDVLAAHQMKEALLLALMERLLTGQGQRISISLMQSGVASLVNQATNYLVAHTIPQRRGSDHPNISPYGTIFTTRDNREIVLAVGTDAQFGKLARIIGRPDLAADPNFKTNVARVKHNAELKAILAERIANFGRDDLLQQLHQAQVPAGPVHTMDEVFDHPEARSLLMTNDLPDAGPITGVRSIAFPTGANGRDKPLLPPPHFNQHRDDVLKKMLGYDDQEIDRLRQAGVTG